MPQIRKPSPRPGRRFWPAMILAVSCASARPASAQAVPEPEPGAGERSVATSLDMAFRYAPAGSFRMGANPDEAWGAPDESPHRVTLSHPFWIGEREVSQKTWKTLMGSRPAGFRHCGSDCPVESINWYEAVAFANALSEREGLEPCYALTGCSGTLGAGCPAGVDGVPAVRCTSGVYSCTGVAARGPACSGYRLPSEAEWEYAARAGATTSIYTGPMAIQGRNDAPDLGRIAWYGGNSGARYKGAVDCRGYVERERSSARCGPQPVAAKPANAWGLHDVLGNVGEWVEDAAGFSAGVQTGVVTSTYAGATTDPRETAGEGRILRGGSWYAMALGCRLADRVVSAPQVRWRTMGFRLARTAWPIIR